MTLVLTLLTLTTAALLSLCMASGPLRSRAVLLFALHLGIAGAVYGTAGLAAPDAAIYHEQAVQFSRIASGEWLTASTATIGKEGWPLLLSGLYTVAGPSPLLGLVVNAWFCAMCVPLIAAIARRVGASDLAADRASWLAFLPPFLIWGSLLLREAGMWFFLLLMCLGALRATRRDEAPSGLFFLGIGLAGAANFRASAALIAGVGILAALTFLAKSATWVKALITVAGLALIPVALRFARTAELTDSASLARSQEALSRAESGYAAGSLGSLPINSARALFGPFPWELPALGPLYAMEWLCWLPVLYVAVRVWRRGVSSVVVLAPAAGILLALAYTSGNYGTMVRLRDSALVVLLPLTALLASTARAHTTRHPTPEETSNAA